MSLPKAQYPQDSTFGQRIRERTNEKVKVADAVIQRFLASGSAVFIGDGSSTFFVGLGMFERQMQATLWTNHLAIAHEFPLWASDHTDLNRMEVWLAGGEVDRDLMMTCRDDAENCTDRWVRRAQSVILSVRGIFPKQGPAGREPKSLAIKKVAVKAALQTGAQVIFLADHEKMVGEYANEPLVFLASSDWEAAMKNNQVFLVTTTHPQATGEDRLFQKPRPGIECFKSCQWVFRRAMRERYIEV